MPFDDNDNDTDLEEEDDIELKEVLKAIASLLCKVRGIARFSRKTNIIQIKMKDLNKRYSLEKVNFILDFHVRWDSSVLTIQETQENSSNKLEKQDMFDQTPT